MRITQTSSTILCQEYKGVVMKLKNIFIIQIIILMIVGVGWVKDIIKLTNCDFKPPYKAEVVYTIGLVPPIGMVTGWLDVGK